MNEKLRGRRVSGVIAVLMAGAVIVSCSENLPTSTSGSGIGNAPTPQRNLIAVNCTASRSSLSVSCGNSNTSSSQGISADGRQYDIIFGGNHQYVNVTSSNVVYGVDSIFSFDVTVQNLIPQTLGTTDGTNPDPAGVRIFFSSGPTSTLGPGIITIPNASGVASFTAPNQPYFQYSGAALGGDGVLTTNETSAPLNWHLKIPPAVQTFAFTIFVSAEVKNPGGYITLGADSSNVIVGSTRTVRGTVRSALGDSVGAVTSWTSLDSTRATVNSSGIVTGVGAGVVGIRGNFHNLEDSTTIFVCNNFSTVVRHLRTRARRASAAATRWCGGSRVHVHADQPEHVVSVGDSDRHEHPGSHRATKPRPQSGTKPSADGRPTLRTPSLDIASDEEIVWQRPGLLQRKACLAQIAAASGAPSSGLRTTLIGSSPTLRKIVNVPVVGALMNINTNSACSGAPSVRRYR